LRKAFSCVRRFIELISKVRRAVLGAHTTDCVTRVRRADVDVARFRFHAQDTVELSRNGSRGGSHFSSTIVVEHVVVGVVNVIQQETSSGGEGQSKTFASRGRSGRASIGADRR
jgi:hypothetical protein